MKLIRLITVTAWIFIAFLLPFQAVNAQTLSPTVITITVQGPLTPSLVGYIGRGLSTAEKQGAELLILQLDTPGGSIDLMNTIVQNIRSSEIPVVVYVAPRGAIAGSAGTLITLAGHIAAMAPETAIGAASPVGGQGEDLGETIEAKQKEILKASVRSLAAKRGSEAIAMAEDTIENARAVSANEALAAGLIDIIASDTSDLVEKINGNTVQLASGPTVLELDNAVLFPVEMSFIENLLQLLTNPNILFLLLTIGVQAIFIELSNPGGWIAGFIGAVCLILAVYGLGVLPVNWFGILFLVTAFILFILEIKAPVHGALTAAGTLSFIVGALVLFNSIEAPGFPQVSVPLVISTGIVLAIGIFFVMRFAIRALKTPVRTGMESLMGLTGYVVSSLQPSGTIQLAGEEWSAISEDFRTLPPGTPIQVINKQGISLIVKQIEKY
ncbi:MAG: nodulation protein NfeD [Anaerolineaceae bacterium]|jgi:membrane-bound serine protease (ClpP class)|nr:nodulation protein NfeD [Anaerolineaceae bacterium]